MKREDKPVEFSCELTGVSKEAMDELLKMSKCSSYDVCITIGDAEVKVATITKAEDISQEIFDIVINKLLGK